MIASQGSKYLGADPQITVMQQANMDLHSHAAMKQLTVLSTLTQIDGQYKFLNTLNNWKIFSEF
jgi:hypothetical protein